MRDGVTKVPFPMFPTKLPIGPVRKSPLLWPQHLPRPSAYMAQIRATVQQRKTSSFSNELDDMTAGLSGFFCADCNGEMQVSVWRAWAWGSEPFLRDTREGARVSHTP